MARKPANESSLSSSDSSSRSTEEPSSEKLPRRDQVPILIVDDEVEITETLRRYFTMAGYHVRTVNDPYTALRLIHQENFLIVISDIAMPGMNGIELLTRIKSYNGMIQVIMMTGYVTLENVLTCLRLGADDCFLKPLKDLQSLRTAVDEAIRKLQKWTQILQEIQRGASRA